MRLSELQTLLRKHNPRITIVKVGDCWECTSHVLNADGYVTLRSSKLGRSDSLHRLTYKLVKGRIPKGNLIRHKCDNRVCVKPSHLLAGTHQDNKDDAVERRRHAFGEKNRHAKLTEAEVQTIKDSTDSNKSLSSFYGVHRNTITSIRKGTTWKHL